MRGRYQEWLVDLAKICLNMAQALFVAGARAVGLIDFPVPLNSSMRKTSSGSIRHYFISGINSYLPIATMALHRKVALDRPIAVLDFGCGVCRQLLHFTRHYPNARYFACDIDRTLIDFVKENYPLVKAELTSFRPPLKCDSNSMDMIYSVSTFSHFSPDDQKAWLAELHRVVKPGGYCFLTTEGWKAYTTSGVSALFAEDAEAAAALLASKGILYTEYDWLKSEMDLRHLSPEVNRVYGIEGTYGCTVMTPDYIRENWSRFGFEVVDVIEGVIDYRQDLVVLRKPSA
jgi:ubiquinone/menaquinone biosynthesis C-methylase UbiE